MSRIGELHKRLMHHLEAAFANVLAAEARLENAEFPPPDPAGTDHRQLALESLSAARQFLVEARKLAEWIDTGEAA